MNWPSKEGLFIRYFYFCFGNESGKTDEKQVLNGSLTSYTLMCGTLTAGTSIKTTSLDLSTGICPKPIPDASPFNKLEREHITIVLQPTWPSNQSYPPERCKMALTLIKPIKGLLKP
jgi:hypothetical protein